MRLPDPERSNAILIGVSKYHDRDLPDLPAARQNVAGLGAALVDRQFGSFHDHRVQQITKPADVPTVYQQLQRAAEMATDTLLVYFAGHGVVSTQKNELYLALPGTSVHALTVSALPMEAVRTVLLENEATNRILILDCCFSGRAVEGAMGTVENLVANQTEIRGTYTLASTSSNDAASAPIGAQYTAFTGALLRLLQNGIPECPELLSLGELYRHLRRDLKSAGFPEPTRHNTNTADLLALTRNRAHAPLPQPSNLELEAEKREAEERETIRKLMTRRRILLTALTGGIGFLGGEALGFWLGVNRDEPIPAASTPAPEPVTKTVIAAAPTTVTTTATATTGLKVPAHSDYDIALAQAQFWVVEITSPNGSDTEWLGLFNWRSTSALSQRMKKQDRTRYTNLGIGGVARLVEPVTTPLRAEVPVSKGSTWLTFTLTLEYNTPAQEGKDTSGWLVSDFTLD